MIENDDKRISKYFYARITGNLALFTDPATKGCGEKYSYDVPTRQALKGIIDNIYWKPTFINVIDEVKIINPIQRESHGTNNLINNGTKNDRSFVTYLTNVEYLVKFHFSWNYQKDHDIFEKDRDYDKHEAIMKKSLNKGGRQDSFLGTRECFGLIESISEADYLTAKSYYNNSTKNLGIMFHSFSYPKDTTEKLKANYIPTTMINGTVTFKKRSDCTITNLIDDYHYTSPNQHLKSVNQEYLDYQNYQ